MAKFPSQKIQGAENVLGDSLARSLPTRQNHNEKLARFTSQWLKQQSTVRAYLASFLGNSIEVDDALQEVALVVWQKGPNEENSSAFLGYTLACARRIALAARRKIHNPRLELLSPDAATLLADRVALVHDQKQESPSEQLNTLKRCLEKLNPQHRVLLESRYSGSSKTELQEYGKRSGKSMETLYKTLERLRTQLRECVERSHHK